MTRTKKRRRSKARSPEESEARQRAVCENDNGPRITFGRRMVKTLPLVLLALLFTFVLNRAGLFAKIETLFLDVQMRMSAPEGESDVVIVEIDDKDFADVFHSQTTPLDLTAFQRVVDAIAGGEPCVVGVDLSTSFDQFRELKTDHLENFVWARDFRVEDEKILPLDVLGREPEMAGQVPAAKILWGIPSTISETGVTRFYTRLVDTEKGKMPSFAWSIFEKADERNCPGIKFPSLDANDQKLTIGFSRGPDGQGRIKVPSSHILKFAEEKWPDKGLIKGKIVLLGGSYRNADRRETPLGAMDGFAINANVIETELRGGGVKKTGTFGVVLLQLFDSVLLMALFQIFPWHRAVLMSLPFILIISFACSFFTYWSFAHWLFFVPVMLGVLATELFDKIKDRLKKQYKSEIKQTYGELTGSLTATEKNDGD